MVVPSTITQGCSGAKALWRKCPSSLDILLVNIIFYCSIDHCVQWKKVEGSIQGVLERGKLINGDIDILKNQATLRILMLTMPSET